MVDQTANFVRGRADASINSSDTTISVADATEFPDPTAGRGEYNLVLWDTASGRPDQYTDVEIIRVTGRDTTNDNLTVIRAQEGTSAASHPSDAALQLSPTAKTIDDITAEKADTDRAVENFSTNGSSGTVPISQGGGVLSMGEIDSRYDSVDVFTADGTFDASDIDTVFVECVGGGGGGGSIDSAGVSSGEFGYGPGGGGGGYAASFVDVSGETSVSITVGGGGGGGSASGGGDGGDSTFGNFVTGGGGSGGSSNDGVGGSGTGDIVISGETTSFVIGGSVNTDVKPQPGGDSVYGSGASAQIRDSSNPSNGETGNEYGGGGCGGKSTGSDTGDGGPGADGVVIVYY